MKWLKNGNLPKLVAFFVVAIILTGTVAYATGGFAQNPSNDSVNNGNTEGGELSSGESDENNNIDESVPVVKPIPEYLHYITGREITSEESYRKPICFTLDPQSLLYGLSDSYLVFEIPIENGKSRLLAYTDDALTLGKIGSLAPTRGFISNLASYCGGILISNGNDANMSTEHLPLTEGYIDLSENIGYHYTELNDYSYTNGDLIEALIKNTKTSTVKINDHNVPYIHNGYFDEPITGSFNANYVKIQYSDTNITEFIYADENEKYLLNKNGSQQKDPLNDKVCEYDNVFILYANSATYETSEYTEAVLDTKGGGTGLYLTHGTYCEITWAVSTDGTLIFLNTNGEKLNVNRGTSYVSFAKSSEYKSVIVE